MVFSLDMIGDYISSGATGWVFEHNREPDKVIKVMKAFPRVGKTILDAFQYDEYLLSRFPDRYNAAHRDYDHEFSTSMLWRPMSAKMMMYMFEETMSYRKSGASVPTGLPKIYDTALLEIPLQDAKYMLENIESSANPDGAETFQENFLNMRGPGHRNSYICVMEKLRVPERYGRSHLRPRVEVFKEVANFLWNDLGMVTRDTANAGNYGFRPNGELVIFDPIVAPLPVSTDWMSNDVYDRLRYNYFSYLFTEEPFPIDETTEAKPVNRKIKKIEKQLASGTFDTVERSAEGVNYRPAQREWYSVVAYPNATNSAEMVDLTNYTDLMSALGIFKEACEKNYYTVEMYRHRSVPMVGLPMMDKEQKTLVLKCKYDYITGNDRDFLKFVSGSFDKKWRFQAEDEEVITRSLGQIPDWELRMMYQQGKISKAQMEIGIGLKMEAEFEVEGVNPSLAVYIGPANHLSVAEVINAEHFVLIDSGPEHDYAGGPEQTDRQQDWFMDQIYDMAKALDYSTDYRFRELNKEGAFVIRFTTPKGSTIDYYFNAAHPFSEDIPEIREALLRADSLIISGFFPHKVILDEMPNLETIFLYDQSIYPLTIQEAATEDTGRNTLIESLFHRSDLTYTVMSSDEDPDAYDDKAPITDQYIELGPKGTFGSYPEAIAAIAVLKETKHFGVEGFPGSVQDEIQIADWSVQDLMYSNSITGNFLEDQAKFNYGLNAEDEDFVGDHPNAQGYPAFPKNNLCPSCHKYSSRPLRNYQNKIMCHRCEKKLFTQQQLEDPAYIDNWRLGKYGKYLHFEAPAAPKVKFSDAKNWLAPASGRGVSGQQQILNDTRDLKIANSLEELEEMTLPNEIGNPQTAFVYINFDYLNYRGIRGDKYKLDNCDEWLHGGSSMGIENAVSVAPVIDGALHYVTDHFFLDDETRQDTYAELYEINLKDYIILSAHDYMNCVLGGVRKEDVKLLDHTELKSLNAEFEAPAAPKVKFPRAKADKIVAEVEAHMKPMVDKIMACGSYRRGSQMIGDIDFVIIPKEGNTLPNMLPPNQGVNWVGENKAQVIIDGEKVDFKVTTPDAWGATILYFTGPADFNIKYRIMAKKQGKKLNEYGVWDRDTETYLAGKTEQDVYTELGRPYKEPKDRKGWNRKKAESETYPRCPICFEYIPNNQTPGKYPGALARYDNQTEICSECGTTEAMVGFMATPEMLATYQKSEKTFEDYRILILNVKHKMPEVMFGRGPEWDILQKLNKDNKNSEEMNENMFKKRLGWKVGTQENLDKRKKYTPMAINLSQQNYHVHPKGFEGLGSLFGAEGMPPKDPWKDCGYPQEFLDELAESNENADTYDEETIELAYQTWLYNKREDSFKAAPSADKVFGVQRHDAHRAGLHYDLRLERDGVLKSWSMPKGMPTDKRHLAIATDDHKMSWLEFEGDIPEGSYGAGNVSLDNTSTFQTVSHNPKKWVFYVNSGKYKGKYTLIHWKEDKWLISRNHDQSMSAEEKVFNAWYDLATEKQRNYIKRLSGDPHPDLNRRQASKLINQLAREKKALDQIDVVAEEE